MIEFVVEDNNLEKNNLEIFEEIKKLKEEIKILKETPKTINNIQNINNIQQNFYSVPMDVLSIRDVFENYYDAKLFYGGPDKVINMLFETLFKKDIKLLDVARKIFQYKIKDSEEDGKLIKDIQNYKALSKIAKEYKKQTNMLLKCETMRHEDDHLLCDEIINISSRHNKAVDDINFWSNIWAKTVGQEALI